jgi:hypothetical protein
MTSELPLGHEFEPPAGVAMTDPAYDECTHRADAIGTMCGAPDGAHDADTAWAYDPNVVSWDWKAQPDLDQLARLLEPLGVALSKVDTGCDEYAVRVSAAERASEPPHAPAEAHTGAPETSGTGSDRGTGAGEAEARSETDRCRLIKTSDGTVWPLPDIELGDESSIGWKLIHAPNLLTKQDQMVAASIIQAYDYLILTATVEKARLVKRDLRAAVKELTSDER